MITCTNCLTPKEDNEFHWRVKNKYRKKTCIVCCRTHGKTHYSRNKSQYIERSLKNSIIYSKINQDYIIEYLKNHPCVDCGEADLLVLEFDHRDHSLKEKGIAQMIKNSPLQKLKAEIEKCDVRCCNCHRRKTLKEVNSWRLHI